MRLQFGPPSASTIATTADAVQCGFLFSGSTLLHIYCPGNPYPGTIPICNGSAWTSFCNPSEPFGGIYSHGVAAGLLNFTVPTGVAGVRLRVRDTNPNYVWEGDIQPPATAVFLNGALVWNQTTCSQCPTTLELLVSPRDTLMMQEHFIFAVYWIELLISPPFSSTVITEECGATALACSPGAPTQPPTPALSTPAPPTVPTAGGTSHVGQLPPTCRHLRQTCPNGDIIRFQFGPPSASTIATTADAVQCGFIFSGATLLHNYCPGNPYRSGAGICNGSSWAPFCASSEPFGAFFSDSIPAGLLNFTLPVGVAGVRLRVRDTNPDSVRPEGPQTPSAAVFLNGALVWNQTTCPQCPTTLELVASPGDTLMMREHNIFVVYWIELLESPPFSATVITEECAATALACPPAAPTTATYPPTRVPPTAAPTTAPTEGGTAPPTLDPSSASPSSQSASSTHAPTTPSPAAPTLTAAPTTSTNGTTTTASPTADTSALGDSGSSGGGSSVGAVVGVTIAVLVVGAGVYIFKRWGAQRQHLPSVPPQSQIVAMCVNSLHDMAGGTATDHEEPVTLQHEDSPHVELDSDLYVADQRARPAEASYAVFRSTEPTAETANDATYNVFHNEGGRQDPDTAA